MQDILAELYLRFASPVVILLLIFIFSLITANEKNHAQSITNNKTHLKINYSFLIQTLCLLCFTIILNYALKITFKIPLDISLHKKGYAFPSGHMNLTTTFYLWLFLHTCSRYWRACILLLLIGFGWGLIRYHYHNLRDVIGGGILGTLVVIFYIRSLKIFMVQVPWLILGISTFLVLYIYLMQFWIINYVQFHYAILVILILLERMFSLNGKRFNLWQTK